MTEISDLRDCLRNPIPEIWAAANSLLAAADAHVANDHKLARDFIASADNPVVRAWTESIWGKASPEIHRFRRIENAPPYLPKEQRPLPRMPGLAVQRDVIKRDGFHCRFCGIPVVSTAARLKLCASYPDVAPWGKANSDQHAALQCMWLQFDHVLPNARGGESTVENIVITCAPCNFGRMDHTLEESCLRDPRQTTNATSFQPVLAWDGLERLLA